MLEFHVDDTAADDKEDTLVEMAFHVGHLISSSLVIPLWPISNPYPAGGLPFSHPCWATPVVNPYPTSDVPLSNPCRALKYPLSGPFLPVTCLLVTLAWLSAFYLGRT